METRVTGRFIESLSNLANRQRWFWKSWDFLRYDLPAFFKNVWVFRKALTKYRWYGYNGVLMFMSTSFEDMAKNIDVKGIEVDSSRKKKVAKMLETQYILERFINDDFIELAEKELGPLPNRDLEFVPCEDKPGFYEMLDNDTPEEKEQREKIYNRTRELEEQMWDQLWVTLKGQDFSKFKNPPESMTDQEEQYKHWDDQFDGSGLRGWWD